MAHPFLVLDRETSPATGSRYVFVRDGFSLWALLFPLPWLLVKRLWLEAGLLLVAYGALGALAAGGDVLWLSILYVFNTVAALWIALDGHHWIIEKHLARGATLKTVIDADTIEEAELRFALADNKTQTPTAIVQPVSFAGHKKTSDMLFATPWGNN